MSDEIARAVQEASRGFERSEIVAHDGTALAVYRAGAATAPLVVIVNPIGVPILIASRLMRSLAERYQVICWEQRGACSDSQTFFERPHDYSAYLADLVHILESTGQAPCALIGICSGASLALRAVTRELVKSAALVLVSPAVFFDDGYVPSLFDKAVVPYMRMISGGNRGLAQDVLDMRAAQARAASLNRSADEQLIEAADKWGLRSLDSLLVYARTLHVFTDQRMDADLAQVRQPVTILAAADDQVVSIRSARRVAQLLAQATLIEYPTGGHFMVFLEDAVRSAICRAVDDGLRSNMPHVA